MTVVPPADHDSGWEYLYFASELARGLEAHQSAYAEYQSQLVRPFSIPVPNPTAYIRTLTDEISKKVKRADQLLNPKVLERAFGPPGQAGDEAAIRAVATQLSDVYAEMISWGMKVRGAAVEDRWRPTFMALAKYVSLPLHQFQGFSATLSANFARVVGDIRAGRPPGPPLEITLCISIDPTASEEFRSALDTLKSGRVPHPKPTAPIPKSPTLQTSKPEASQPTALTSQVGQPVTGVKVMPLVRVEGGGKSFTIRSGPRKPRVDPMGKTRWYPPGNSASVVGVSIPDGMVYIGSKVSVDGYYGSAAGIIDETLEVAFGPAPGSEPDIGYWPNYRRLTPYQRGGYLTWLIEGRSAPLDQLTYPFLFFYGLERRVLSDLDVRIGHEELISIFHELRRLASIYGNDRAFSAYTSSLCDFITVILIAQGIEAPGPWGRDRRWGQSTEVLIEAAVAAKRGLPLPGAFALALVRSHPSARLRTPARRCRTEFDELFLIHYQEQYGAGIVISDPEAGPLTLSHHTGGRNVPLRSFIFHHSALGDAAFGEGMPVELEIAKRKQWGLISEIVLEDLPAALVDDHLPPGLAELAAECQDALAKYSRHLASKGASPDSEKAKSLLPPELQRSRRGPVTAQVDLEIVAGLLASDEVTALLAERLADTDEETGRATPAVMGTSITSADPTPSPNDDGNLDAAHRELAQRLAERTLWSKEEASQIASTLGFPFFDSAVARINEAALDTTGALFVTGDDPMEVDHETYKEMTVDR